MYLVLIPTGKNKTTTMVCKLLTCDQENPVQLRMGRKKGRREEREEREREKGERRGQREAGSGKGNRESQDGKGGRGWSGSGLSLKEMKNHNKDP